MSCNYQPIPKVSTRIGGIGTVVSISQSDVANRQQAASANSVFNQLVESGKSKWCRGHGEQNRDHNDFQAHRIPSRRGENSSNEGTNNCGSYTIHFGKLGAYDCRRNPNPNEKQSNPLSEPT